MAFYADFAGHYEKIFPLRPEVLAFLDRRLPGRGRILDIGCGTGDACAALDRSGRRCLGIDLDPGMIGRAEQRHPDGQFRLMGMEEIGLLSRSTFAGAICLGNVLPHLPGDRLADFLLDVKRLLAPGGIWIFQTVNFDPLLRSGVREHAFADLRIPQDDLVFQRRYKDIEPDCLTFVTRLSARGREIFQGEVELAPRASLEYILGHQAAGFQLLGHYADYRERPFVPEEPSGSVFVWRLG